MSQSSWNQEADRISGESPGGRISGQNSGQQDSWSEFPVDEITVRVTVEADGEDGSVTYHLTREQWTELAYHMGSKSGFVRWSENAQKPVYGPSINPVDPSPTFNIEVLRNDILNIFENEEFQKRIADALRAIQKKQGKFPV